MTKSLTSTLVGTALKSGAIGSLEDPVTRYLPGLTGGGYDGVQGPWIALTVAKPG